MEHYDPKVIEPKWQKKWEETGAFTANMDSRKKKFYGLIEFPYPSGEGLHTGHVRSNTAMDVIARKRRAEGFEVLYPIGWDAFGLPTENFAIKTGIHPAEVTKRNTDIFRRQLKALGFSFDWSREINTTDPAYYKWTQWIFLQLYKKSLAYKAKTFINWCPKCKIGLANEEVVGGECERCNFSPIEKREKEQWMLAITKYAQRLYDDLDTVDYIERAKTQQRNWIGPSEGAEIGFEILSSAPGPSPQPSPEGRGGSSITVFTTRPDTLFGATYVVLAPEHSMVGEWAERCENVAEIRAYAASAAAKEDMERTAEQKEKTGVELKGIRAINPATKEEIPVWVADYVLGSYGTGAVMAVPAHDERDFAFAKKFGLPIRAVVARQKVTHACAFLESKQRPGTFLFQLRGHDAPTAPDQIVAFGGGVEPEDADVWGSMARELEEELELRPTKDMVGNSFVSGADESDRYIWSVHLRGVDEDVLVQHEGVAIVPLTLAEALAHEKVRASTKSAIATYFFNETKELFTGTGVLINSGEFDGMSSEDAKKKITEFAGGKIVTKFKLRDWVFSRQRYWGEPIPMVKCEKDGWVPVPEDQLPVVLPKVEKYQPTDTGESPLALFDEWVNTTCPTCGGPAKRETDVMPNWAGSSWYFLRYCDPKNDTAVAAADLLKYWMPVDWYNGGMEHVVLHLLYSRFWHKFLFDIGVVPTAEPYAKRTSHGLLLAGDGTKMSKSKGNVVNPDSVVEPYGADALRLYEMFMGPFDQEIAWNTEGVVGVRRFIERVWKLQERMGEEDVAALAAPLQKTIKKVSEDIEAMKFNTAVSQMMIFLNLVDDAGSIGRAQLKVLVQLLAPFTPHVAEELWECLGGEGLVHSVPWPLFNEQLLAGEPACIIIQVNGKARGVVETSRGTSEVAVIELATKAVAARLADKTIQRTVFIPDRLINFVLAE